MANNEHINKVVKSTGETLIDLTSDTVTPGTLLKDVTAHDKSGAQITGTFVPVTGVKGNDESSYRTGNVNLTPANIGAATTAQGTKADSAVQTIQMNGSTVTKTSGTVNLGTVITAHQDISGKADKSATVSTIAYDTTNKKLTKTINGTTTDVVTTAKLKTDMALSKSDVGLGNVGNFKAVSTAALQNLTDTEKANARTNIGLPVANDAGFHNNYFRGKDLTNVYTIEQMYEKIHDGTFEDLFIGDYFTKSMTTDIYTRFTGDSFASGTVYYEMGGTLTDRTWTETEDTAPQTGKIYATKTTKTENVTLMFAAFDYYYNIGDTALTTHHAVLIPRGYGFATTAKMNSSNTTVGSYFNSDMHQIVLPCYAKALKTVLNNHLLAHRTILPNAISASTPSMAGVGMTGASNAWAWETVELQLMSEPQIYGTTVWSSSAYDVGADCKKLPVFDFINGVQYGRTYYWLRSVVSSTYFALCTSDGAAYGYGASSANCVRPLILFG